MRGILFHHYSQRGLCPFAVAFELRDPNSIVRSALSSSSQNVILLNQGSVLQNHLVAFIPAAKFLLKMDSFNDVIPSGKDQLTDMIHISYCLLDSIHILSG